LPCRNARVFIITKKTGTKISTFIVEVIMPPTIGAAIGFITSDPTPVSHKIGTGSREPPRRSSVWTQALDLYNISIRRSMITRLWAILRSGIHVIGMRFTPISPRKPVFPKTFDRLGQFQPKIGQTAKKWLKLPGESELMEFSNRPRGFFRQAQAQRVWRQGRIKSRARFNKDCVGRLTERDGWGSVMSSSFK
jgi:hypothetical protein